MKKRCHQLKGLVAGKWLDDAEATRTMQKLLAIRPMYKTTTSNNAEHAWSVLKEERETAEHFSKFVGLTTKLQAMF